MPQKLPKGCEEEAAVDDWQYAADWSRGATADEMDKAEGLPRTVYVPAMLMIILAWGEKSPAAVSKLRK